MLFYTPKNPCFGRVVLSNSARTLGVGASDESRQVQALLDEIQQALEMATSNDKAYAKVFTSLQRQ